jgi:nicotinic acid phosphoribosyltransferase
VRFQPGQQVVRVDSVTGRTWGDPVTIISARREILPAHGIDENRYTFHDRGLCEFPESALTEYGPPPKPRLSWWEWLFHD